MITTHSFIAALSSKLLILNAFIKVHFGRGGTEAKMLESRGKIQPLKQRRQKMSSKMTLVIANFATVAFGHLNTGWCWITDIERRGVSSGGVWFLHSGVGNRGDGQWWQRVSHALHRPLSDLALLTSPDSSLVTSGFRNVGSFLNSLCFFSSL